MRGLLEAIRNGRGMNGPKMPWLKRGMVVTVAGKHGRITGGNTHMNLQVRFDGEKFSRNCHPWWETIYYDSDDKVLADFTAGRSR